MQKKADRIAATITIVACMLMLVYIGMKVSNLTAYNVSITYNGKKVDATDKIRLKVFEDGKPVKKMWKREGKNKVHVVHMGDGLSTSSYAFVIPPGVIDRTAPAIKCVTNYYNASEFDCAMLNCDIDVVKKHNKWFVNCKLKSRNLFYGETRRKSYQAGKEKSLDIM